MKYTFRPDLILPPTAGADDPADADDDPAAVPELVAGAAPDAGGADDGLVAGAAADEPELPAAELPAAVVLLELHAAMVASATTVAAPSRRRILVFEVIEEVPFLFRGIALCAAADAAGRRAGRQLEYVERPLVVGRDDTAQAQNRPRARITELFARAPTGPSLLVASFGTSSGSSGACSVNVDSLRLRCKRQISDGFPVHQGRR